MSVIRLMPNLVATKRPPAVTDGKRADPITYLTNVKCSNLFPVEAEVAQLLPNRSPKELLQCFVPGTEDVLEGDILVFDSREYPIRAAAEWSLRTRAVTHLILEDLKTR